MDTHTHACAHTCTGWRRPGERWSEGKGGPEDGVTGPLLGGPGEPSKGRQAAPRSRQRAEERARLLD